MRILVVVDMQNDFVDGALGSPEAAGIVDNVVKLIDGLGEEDYLICTSDTHGENYMNTLEGRKLPVEHCIEGTNGWDTAPAVAEAITRTEATFLGYVDKITFGSPIRLPDILSDVIGANTTIEICGLCTDICVVSNALILRAWFNETNMIVHKTACAGTSIEAHEAALKVMQSCQIDVED